MPRESVTEERLANPAKRFYQWSADEGCMSYYDKEKQEKVKIEISATAPFTFLPIGVFYTIKGYCESDKSSLTANEVKGRSGDVVVVNTWVNKRPVEKARGSIADIYDKITAIGGKVSCSVYAAVKNGKELEIINIQFYGAAYKPWRDFMKKQDVAKCAVAIVGSTEGKKGKIRWENPVFKAVNVKKETDDAAGELQKELKVYHDAYFAKAAVSNPPVEESKPATQSSKPVPSDNPSFEQETGKDINVDAWDDDDQAPF